MWFYNIIRSNKNNYIIKKVKLSYLISMEPEIPGFRYINGIDYTIINPVRCNAASYIFL